VARFAVLSHDWPEPHFDLFLEAGSELLSWKLPTDFSPSHRSPIASGSPHRVIYLDYEGAVGGGRGTVARWDTGQFRWIEEGKRAEFFGRKLTGIYEWVGERGESTTFGPVT